MNKYLTLKQLMERLQISKATVYTNMKKGLLPKPIYIGVRTPRWKEKDINNLKKQGV